RRDPAALRRANASPVMTDDDLRAAAAQLDDCLPPFARLFGKAQARRHARTYLCGLLSPLPRKTIEPIAHAVGEGRTSALQKFIHGAPWEAAAAFKERQREVGTWLRDRSAGPVVLSVHEYGFAKKGRESVGVARQWNAATGRSENCQVGVYLLASAAELTCMVD